MKKRDVKHHFLLAGMLTTYCGRDVYNDPQPVITEDYDQLDLVCRACVRVWLQARAAYIEED